MKIAEAEIKQSSQKTIDKLKTLNLKNFILDSLKGNSNLNSIFNQVVRWAQHRVQDDILISQIVNKNQFKNFVKDFLDKIYNNIDKQEKIKEYIKNYGFQYLCKNFPEFNDKINKYIEKVNDDWKEQISNFGFTKQIDKSMNDWNF